jgi:ribosomal protein L40E
MSVATGRQHVGEDRPVGGYPPGSYEAIAAIERVGRALNPGWQRIALTGPETPYASGPHVCMECGAPVSKRAGLCKRCAGMFRGHRMRRAA